MKCNKVAKATSTRHSLQRAIFPLTVLALGRFTGVSVCPANILNIEHDFVLILLLLHLCYIYYFITLLSIPPACPLSFRQTQTLTTKTFF